MERWSVVVSGGLMMGDISDDHTRHRARTLRGPVQLGEARRHHCRGSACAPSTPRVIGTLLRSVRRHSTIPGEATEPVPSATPSASGVTFNGVAGQSCWHGGGLRGPSLAPCAQRGAPWRPIAVARASGLYGKSASRKRAHSPEKVAEGGRFDALPSTVQIPVPEPESVLGARPRLSRRRFGAVGPTRPAPR